MNLLLLLLSIVLSYSTALNLKGINNTSDDIIKILPGLSPQPTFAHYSGYLQGSTENYQIHYWFVEAVTNPQTAPLILWLNGGPGCSSIQGLLNENGPFTTQHGGSLEYNPYSWNKFANVLYFESPANVGYSFTADHNASTDDNLTSLNNYHALLHFLRKFPAYRDLDFYITGESYGGVYVPTLALRVIEDNENGLKLKGIAVGNGLLSYRLNDNSEYYFYNYHGMIDESHWNDALSNCCHNQCSAKCYFNDDVSTPCQLILDEMKMQSFGLDSYNLYNPCAGGVPTEANLIRASSSKFVSDNLLRKNLLRSARNMAQSVSKNLPIPCVDDTNIRTFMNRADVRSALHIDSRAPTEWNVCSEEVNTQYTRIYQDMSESYLKILNSSVNVMLYAGDVDMACNFLGILWFVDALGLQLEKPMSSWLYHETDGSKQIGGYYKLLGFGEAKLWYATIRGAGHMVPQDKPIPMYHLITRFIENEHL